MKVRTFKVLNSKGDIELIYLKPYYGMKQHEIQNVNDYDEDIFNVNVFKLYEEKQQLISFLEDLIEETECAYDYKENDYKNSGKWNLLNEILDFVNKGDKE